MSAIVIDDSPPKSETTKYEDVCLSLGFTANVVGDEKRPLCVLFLKTLAVGRMKPNGLNRNLGRIYTGAVSQTNNDSGSS